MNLGQLSDQEFSLPVPGYVHEWVNKWMFRLGIHGLHCEIIIEDCVLDSPDNEAACDQLTRLNFFYLRIRSDVQDTQHWEIVVVHELLHALHGQIDDFVENVSTTGMKKRVKDMLRESYHVVYEPFIQGLAKSLVMNWGVE